MPRLEPELAASVDRYPSRLLDVPEVEPIDGLLTISQLVATPPSSWHIYGVLPEDAFTVLYGQFGIGKSFLALDWACCTAAGVPWQGRPVDQGAVLYIAAEGSGGVRVRLESWLISRRLAWDGLVSFYMLPEPVDVANAAEVDKVAAMLGAMPEPPALIVVDTLARTLSGDEDKAVDTKPFVDGIDGLARPYGAARVVVHHPGKNGTLRGSSSLPGAADAVMRLDRLSDGTLSLSCEKQKDAEQFAPILMRSEKANASLVLRSNEGVGSLSTGEAALIRAIQAEFGTSWIDSAKVKEVYGKADSTYYYHRKAAIRRGLLEVRGDRATSEEVRLTEAGGEAIQPIQ